MGYGDRRIGPPDGKYHYTLGDVTFEAADDESSSKQDLTWNNLLKGIQLLGYCEAGKGIFKETEATVYAGKESLGVINVKIAEGSGEN